METALEKERYTNKMQRVVHTGNKKMCRLPRTLKGTGDKRIVIY